MLKARRIFVVHELSIIRRCMVFTGQHWVCVCMRCDNTSIPDTWSWSQTASTQRTSIFLYSDPQTFRQTKMDTALLLGLIIIELQIIHLLVRNGSGFVCDCKKWKRIQAPKNKHSCILRFTCCRRQNISFQRITCTVSIIHVNV